MGPDAVWTKFQPFDRRAPSSHRRGWLAATDLLLLDSNEFMGNLEKTHGRTE